MHLSADFSSFYTAQIGLSVILVRLGAACILGALLGADREVLARPAGLRTFMLVCLAAATFTIVTFELLDEAQHQGVTNVDPTRVVQAVTAGVAFLAAGAIIQARGQVYGVTTGAGLWLAGAIGTACGLGAFMIAVSAALLGLVLLALLRSIDRLIPHRKPPPSRMED